MGRVSFSVLQRLRRTHEPLPEKWDVADALAEGFTAANFDGVDLFEPLPTTKKPMAQPDRAGFYVVEGVKGRLDGVYWQEPANDDDEAKPAVWLCSPLHVLAETRDSAQSNWGRLLYWKDNDGHEHHWACPASLLAASDTAEFRKTLADKGLTISTHSRLRQKMVDYVLTSDPLQSERARCVTRIGWHGDRYVLPGKTFGLLEGESVIYQGGDAGNFTTSGRWQIGNAR